jgi:predicted lipid-binding transport protein (Tim44 family)
VPSSELEKRPVQTPDPHDEPSAEWGWHGTLPRGARIGGIFIVIAMFGMLIGNQIGHVEDIFLVLTGLIMISILLLSARRRRSSWRR